MNEGTEVQEHELICQQGMSRNDERPSPDGSPGMAVAGLCDVDPHNYTMCLQKVSSPSMMTTSVIV